MLSRLKSFFNLLTFAYCLFMFLEQVGVALFKDRPTCLYPFSAMDANQLYFTEEVVRECLTHCDVARTSQQQCRGDSHSTTSSSSSCLPFYHLHHHAVVQMGGGCILYLHHHCNHDFSGMASKTAAPTPSKKRGRSDPMQEEWPQQQKQQQGLLLPPAEVLKSMCDCIFASTTYGDVAVRSSICSIVMQRVVSMTNVISREDQRLVDAYCQELSTC